VSGESSSLLLLRVFLLLQAGERSVSKAGRQGNFLFLTRASETSDGRDVDTPMLRSRLPVHARVGFQGVDWEVETEKSQQGLERRKKARQLSARRKERKTSDSKLLSFLRFAIQGDNSQPSLSMNACDDLLRKVNAEGHGLSNEKKEEKKVEVKHVCPKRVVSVYVGWSNRSNIVSI
jgi:hypothetical protein